MSQAAPILREIKNIFNRQGINNDVQIASYLGFLLLVRDHWGELRSIRDPRELSDLFEDLHRRLEREIYFSPLLPAPPNRQLKNDGLYEIIHVLDLLERAIDLATIRTVGDFFQHEVRFEILKDVRRESYPTPHHLADFMAALGVRHNDPSTKIIDLTAGTGGLLAAALSYAPDAEFIGYDYDPNIAQLGITNLLLHRQSSVVFHQESAFTLAGRWHEPNFDTVLMNPPFGGTRSAGEVEQLRWHFFDDNYGRSVHTLLAVVALHILRPGGQASFLLPTGSLFGSGGEERLRHSLLRRHHLEAVITLNKELFQPYSGVAAHLIVVQKGENAVTDLNAIWFGEVSSDGYPTGAGRDLTASQDLGTNELPRMRDLVLCTRTADWDLSLTLAEDTYLRGLLLQPTDGLPGVALIKEGPAAIRWHVSALPSGILAAIAQDSNVDTDDIPPLAQLYLLYQGDMPTILRPEQVANVTWSTAIPAAWSPTIVAAESATWQGDTETITAQVEAASTLILKSGTTRSTTYRFQHTDTLDAAPIACLVSGEGQPLTPWLTIIANQTSQSIQDAAFAEKFAALPLLDATQTQCGWIVQLSAQNETATLPDGLLLILFAQIAILCHAPTLNEQIAMLPDGWMRIAAQGTVHVEMGERVRLRNDVASVGFAIGPTPTGSAESHCVFAVAVPKPNLFDTDSGRVESFEPRRFLPEPETADVGHPSEIIANIRKNQARLGLQVDLLLNLLGSSTQRGQAIENPVAAHPLIHLLEAKQQQFWQQLQQLATADADSSYFTADELSTRLPAMGYTEDFIRQQLDLFIRMGLIEAVHIGERNLYRLSALAGGEPSL